MHDPCKSEKDICTMDTSTDYATLDQRAGSEEDVQLLQEALTVIGDHCSDVLLADAGAVSATSASPLSPDDCEVLESLLWPSDEAEDILNASTSDAAQWPELSGRIGQRKPSHTQTRRRQELQNLRGLVTELEGKLSALRSSDNHEVRKVERQDDSNDVVTTLWKNVAANQRAQRLRAEQENAQLKRLLREITRHRKRFEKVLLRKRPSSEEIQSTESQTKRLQRTVLQTWDHSPIYDELLASCAHLNAKTGRVLSLIGQGQKVPMTRTVELVETPECGMVLQTTERLILPFHYEDTANVLWGMFHGVSPQRTILHFDSYHDREQDRDATKLQFKMRLEIAHSTGDFAVKAVKRRFVESQRVVIVYSAHVEPFEVSATNMDGISVRDKVWHVVEPLPRRKGSLITIFCASVPQFDAEIPGQERKAGLLTNFLRSTIPVELDTCNHLLENLLLERSLHRDPEAIR